MNEVIPGNLFRWGKKSSQVGDKPFGKRGNLLNSVDEVESRGDDISDSTRTYPKRSSKEGK